MLVHFHNLNGDRERKDFVEKEDQAREFWEILEFRGATQACGALRAVDERLELTFPSDSSPRNAQILYAAPAARPLAELVAHLAPRATKVTIGRGQTSHEYALKRAHEDNGVDLSSSRVRVGFTRGHLMEIVVQVPLDVEGESDDLQVAAEIYLEERLGDATLDQWVGDISVDRISRTKGLLMFGDVASPSNTHRLQEVHSLIAVGVAGVIQELPISVFSQERTQDWLALEIPEMPHGLQPDRTFASTRFPEEVKSALEGLPFCSQRFTRGPEILLWFRWSAPADHQARLALREEVERAIIAPQYASVTLLAGTGFGRKSDYIDLWTLPETHALGELGRELAAIVGTIELGFYDSSWAEEFHLFQA